MSYLAHLYPHLRIHQVFGANTDVGKTIFTTALALASASFPLDSPSSQSAAKDEHGYPIPHMQGEQVHYIKPVSTGSLEDADNLHINRFAPATNAFTLYQFEEPISPHLAAARSSQPTPSDELVRTAISEKVLSFSTAHTASSAAFIETAGGVHSPAPSGSSMAQLLRPLRLPTILIGDSQLGGISTTKSAYDSLILAGHDVQALLLFSDASRGLGNAEYLKRWGQEIGLPVWGLAGETANQTWGLPPSRAASRTEDERNMRNFYRGLVYGRGQRAEPDESQTGLLDVVQNLRNSHLKRIGDLDTMAARTLQSCWWPFTQHTLAKTPADVNVIDSAHGDFFSIYKPGSSSSLLQRTLDGSASWWTQCLGHGDTSLTYAATRAAARYGHVLFPMCSSEPALRLSEMLIGREKNAENEVDLSTPAPGRGWASRVFFSDDGSTGMEVALKMAISSTAARYSPSAKAASTKERISKGKQAGYQGGRPAREWKVLGLKGSYHGDTIGAMDACEGSIYNERVHWYRGRGDWLEAPKVGVKDGKIVVELPLHDSDWQSLQDGRSSFEFGSIGQVYDVEERVKSDGLYKTYTTFIRAWLDRLTGMEGNRYGALILEPLVMGAGGMIFVDPLFQRCLVDVVRDSEEYFARTDPPLKAQMHLSTPSGQGEWKGLPIIFDEVFTGLYRLGYSTPALPLGIRPDISVLAKILTGGMVPMSVTLASQSIFETFNQSDQKVDALLHGHSYTAHPIGCEVARETLHRIEDMRRGGKWSQEQSNWSQESHGDGEGMTATVMGETSSPWSFWQHEAVMRLSKLEKVDKAMAMGTVLVVELKDMTGAGGYSSTASVDLLHRLRNNPDAHFTIHARPLGNVVYFMCSLNTPEDVRRKTEEALTRALQ